MVARTRLIDDVITSSLVGLPNSKPERSHAGLRLSSPVSARPERPGEAAGVRRADIASVRAYRSAVGLRTREVVGTLRPEAWDEIVSVEDIRRAAAAGALPDWVEGATYPWLGWTRGDQLASSALRHNATHIGEAVTIRGLAGFAVGI